MQSLEIFTHYRHHGALLRLDARAFLPVAKSYLDVTLSVLDERHFE
jgi:hypothetical protein